MNASFAAYVASAKVLAEGKGLLWNMPCDTLGKIKREHRWDLTALVGMIPPPSSYVSEFGIAEEAVRCLNIVRRQMRLPELVGGPISSAWRDLYLAVIVDQVLVRKNKPLSGLVLGRSIKLLASASGGTPPWAVTPEHVRQAYNAVLLMGESGKNALNFEMTIRTILDDQRLSDTPALARFCIPMDDHAARQGQQRVQNERRRVGRVWSTGGLRARLSDRKSAAKLPEERAFWELVRIVCSETPRTFTDVIRFAVLKLGVITGLRVGEITTLPLDCRRWREYVDSDGQPAGKKGGQSRSLMLRHFAEKQVEDERADGICLYENAQHVPPMFEEFVLETLDSVERVTAPLRERLKRQVGTNRLFPEYQLDELVPAHEMYTRISGSVAFSNTVLPADIEDYYRQTLDISVFDKIRDLQVASSAAYRPTSVFWLRQRNEGKILIRDSAGEIRDQINWRKAFLRVDEVEAYIRTHAPTKLSDLKPALLSDGSKIHPHDLLFLVPIRNLIEGRNGGLLDPTRYVSVGRISVDDIQNSLDCTRPESLFHRYGAEEEDRTLTLNTHALRHLQTTELFRLGVADTIITKRFNRRSVAQSYEYDHRSLLEDLTNIDVAEPSHDALSDNARELYRLIINKKVSGPIIDEFYQIQRQHGDGIAFEYLNAEADGLHVTPYGFCVNSFAVDPCPKNLECFNGCRHLARSDVDEERTHLERLRDRMASALETLNALPEEKRSIGWRNQIMHAQVRHSNILATLAARPGERPFSSGPDLYQSIESRCGTSVLDTSSLLRDPP